MKMYKADSEEKMGDLGIKATCEGTIIMYDGGALFDISIDSPQTIADAVSMVVRHAREDASASKGLAAPVEEFRSGSTQQLEEMVKALRDEIGRHRGKMRPERLGKKKQWLAILEELLAMRACIGGQG